MRNTTNLDFRLQYLQLLEPLKSIVVGLAKEPYRFSSLSQSTYHLPILLQYVLTTTKLFPFTCTKSINSSALLCCTYTSSPAAASDLWLAARFHLPRSRVGMWRSSHSNSTRSNFECLQQIRNSSNFFTYPSSNSNLRYTRSEPHIYTHRPPEQPTEQMRIA